MDVHPQPSTLRERSHEPPNSSSGQKEEDFHEEVRNSAQGDSKTSKHTILIDGGCANQMQSTDECLKLEGVPTDGLSQLYVGGI